MESFLLESVGLKSGPAASVMKHMAEQYEIEDKEDLKHLTQRDMEDIISNCGLKRVPAGKLLVAWNGGRTSWTVLSMVEAVNEGG